MTEQDFEWLAKEAKVTSLRVPIGFFTWGPGFCKGTKFEGVKEIYANAWAAVEELVGRARAWETGILLDPHALPRGTMGRATPAPLLGSRSCGEIVSTWMDRAGTCGAGQEGEYVHTHLSDSLIQEINNRAQSAQEGRAGIVAGAKGSHKDYWRCTSPGQSF